MKILKIITLPIRRLLVIPLVIIAFICWIIYAIIQLIVWCLTGYDLFDRFGDPDELILVNFDDFGQWMTS